MSIHAKLLAAQKAVHGIAKTGHNAHFNYKFFEEREVLSVTRDALSGAGLAFIYSVEDVTDREVETKNGRVEWITDVRMVCTLYDGESGESLSGKAIGRGQDGQDKGINKAIVAGLKYWLLKTLMIPTEDDTERNENTNADGNARTRSASRPTPEQRMYQKPTEPVGVQHSNAPAGTFDLSELVPVGKHKGRAWAWVVEHHPDYIEWALENMSRLDDYAKAVLREALGLVTVPAPPVDDRPLSEPAQDGLPF